MLRTILEDEELIVKDVITQNSEKNLYGDPLDLMHFVHWETEKNAI